MQVTYDLGIAMIAMPIKSTEKEIFQKLFIHVGLFHLGMAWFGAVGKTVNGRGMPTIITEAQLMGPSSVKSFISEKHFNCCKRTHMLVSLALEQEEFKMFLDGKNIEISDEIKTFFDSPTVCLEEENEEIKGLIISFEYIHNACLAGKYGKTKQFYAKYIEFIKYYLMLDHSVRMNDVDSLIYILSKLNAIFFELNHHNYARWILWYV